MAIGLGLRIWLSATALAPGSILGQPMGDSQVYIRVGLELLSSGPAARAPFYWSPLYTLAVGAAQEPGILWLIRAQIAAGLGLVWLILLAGRRIGGNRAGLIAALLAALYAPLLMFETKLLPVVFATGFAFAGVILIPTEPDSRGVSSQHLWRWFGSGISIGLAGLLMPQLLLVPLVIGAMVLVKRRYLAPLLLLCGVAAAVAPVSVRNWSVSRDFVPVSSSGGFNFYLGSNQDATGLIGRPTEMLETTLSGRRFGTVQEQEAFQRLYAEAGMGKRLRPSEVSGFWLRRGIGYILRNPGRAARLWLDKLLLSLTGYEFSNSYYPELEKRLAWPLRLAFLPFAVVLGLAGAGVIAARRSGFALWPLSGLVIAVLGSLLLFFVNARFRLPAFPGLCVLAGVGVDGFILGPARLRAKATVVAALLALASGVVLPVVFRGRIRVDEACGWRNLSMNAQAAGDLGQASRFLERAAKLSGRSQDADIAEAYFLLGNRFLDRGDFGPAQSAYRQAQRFDRGLAQAWMMHGVAALLQGEFGPALADAEAAVRLDSLLAGAYVLKARALIGLGRRDEAAATAQTAARLDPESGIVVELLRELGD